jgi:hypothetical protein
MAITPIAAQKIIVIPGSIVIDPRPQPNPPQSDLNRCAAIAFAEFDDVRGATNYTFYGFDSYNDRTEIRSGPPFNDTVIVSVANPDWRWEAPDGRHRFNFSLYSTGQGCDAAKTALEGRFRADSVQVTVPDSAPNPRFTWWIQNPQDDSVFVHFDASASSDDGTIVSYEWNFGNRNGEGIQRMNEYHMQGTYMVTLKVTDNTGLQSIAWDTVTIGGEQSSVSEEPVVSPLVLHQASPTPTDGATRISFSLAKPETIWLYLYDVNGELISRLINGERHPTGSFTVDLNTAVLTNGVYIYQLRSSSGDRRQRYIVVQR